MYPARGDDTETKDTAWPPLIDHHCHGVAVGDLARTDFEALMNEASAPGPIGTSFFESMEGLAVRRWCPPVLDLPPLASAEEYLGRRKTLGGPEVARRFLTASATQVFLVDTGYAPHEVLTPDGLAGLAGRRAYEILRLESLVEQLLTAGTRCLEVPDQVLEILSTTTAVGAKSIAAYRVGLSLPAVKPGLDEFVATLSGVVRSANGRYRLAHPILHGWLAWAAVEAGLPLQFHVGYGDNDVDLHECDPLLLTRFLRATEDRGVPVLLLHNYPFHRNAGYLAQVFEHVFVDLGLATHNTGALSVSVVREMLELAPFGKVLYSSDAYGLAELYYLASTLFRRAVDAVLDGLLSAGDASAADAERIVSLIAAENARRVYAISGE